MNFSEKYDLTGKTAVVTGASKGIGRGTALALAKQGADLILSARNENQLNEVAAEIEKLGRRVKTVCVDVTSKEQVDNMMQNIVPAFGGVDIFVNNAGITVMKRIIDTLPEDIDNIFDTNLKGAIYFLQNAAKLMLRQGRGGSIIIVTSINAIAPLPSQAFYSSTKAALEAIMKCLAADLAKEGIRVNSVAPGAIATDMNSHFTPEVAQTVAAKIPLGRIGEPDEIGDAVAYLASDAARYITGSTIVADGGYLLRT
jgi:3-oxoacyl-[acyl-carrier protein] reductase